MPCKTVNHMLSQNETNINLHPLVYKNSKQQIHDAWSSSNNNFKLNKNHGISKMHTRHTGKKSQTMCRTLPPFQWMATSPSLTACLYLLDSSDREWLLCQAYKSNLTCCDLDLWYPEQRGRPFMSYPRDHLCQFVLAYTLGNKYAKNLCKWTLLLQLIKNVVTCFLNTVYI